MAHEAGREERRSSSDTNSNRDDGSPSTSDNSIQDEAVPQTAEIGYEEKTSQITQLEPPVTKATLSELDRTAVINNIWLRHAINFDKRAGFAPDFRGDNGAKKLQRVSDFWEYMQEQLQAYNKNQELFEEELLGKDWILPIILKNIREILETLLPPEAWTFVKEALDVDLFMQQLRKGVADPERLTTYLSQVIKRYCAPGKDPLVDEMTTQITLGNQTSNFQLLTEGFSTFLTILEYMKLDFAYHTVRQLRPELINGTVDFEQEYFLEEISEGLIDLRSARTWYARTHTLSNLSTLNSATSQQAKTWQFMKGLVDLIRPSNPNSVFPDTFLLDKDHLAVLRTYLGDIVNLDICIQTCQELYKTRGRCAIPCNDNPGRSFSTPSFHCPTCRENVRNRLRGIIGHSTTSEKWAKLTPSLALEIGRAAGPPFSCPSDVQSKLERHLSSSSSEVYQDAELRVMKQLSAQLYSLVETYQPLTCLEIFNRTAGREERLVGISSSQAVDSRDNIREIASEIAHIGVLHWRVWAPLVYLNPTELPGNEH